MWYDTSTWRNLVDMHIPDWREGFLDRLSAEAYANAVEAGHPDTALIYTSSSLGICYWPTPVGHMHRGLHGRDHVGELSRLLRAKGMHVIFYYSIWNNWAYETHPSWRIRGVDGRDARQQEAWARRWGQCCLNAKGYQAFVRANLIDLMERYDFDGFWIDMIGWLSGMPCYCEHCRQRYYDETGEEDIPRTIDWRDAHWLRFQRLRERWFCEFAEMIRTTVKALKPALTLTQTAAMVPGSWVTAVSQAYLDRSDYLAGDFYGSPLAYSVICKYLRNASKNQPIEFMTSRCIVLEDHTTTKSNKELTMSAQGAFAHNAAFLYIDAIDPDGSLNARFHQDIGRIRGHVRPYKETVSVTAKLLCDVAVYANLPSIIDMNDNGKDANDQSAQQHTLRGHLMNIARTLIDHNIAYDLIGRAQLDRLDEYPLIVLPRQYVLGTREQEALEGYVSRGGRLIATGETGAIDGHGVVEGGALKAVLGVTQEGALAEDIAYMAPTEAGRALFAHADERYPLYVCQQFVQARPNDAVETLAEVIRPYSRSDEDKEFGSGLSNPPLERAGCPAMTVHPYGQGKAMFIAAALELEKSHAQRDTMAALVRHMLQGCERIAYEAPAWVEVIAFHDEASRTVKVSAMRSVDEADGLIARGVRVRMRLDIEPTRAVEAASGRAVPVSVEDGWVCLAFFEFEDFAMVMIAY